mgnify:CR=1 FL=1
MSRAVTRELAEWIASVKPQDIPPDVAHQAKRALLDYLGAALAGSTTRISRGVRDYLYEADGGSTATVVGSDRKLGPLGAALANGAAAHGLEIDDGYTKGSVHPGTVCFPAVLAAAEAHAARVDQVIAACAVAIEVTCRLSGATHPATWRQGFHNTGVNGVFGAAAGVANLLGLDAERTLWALGIAASSASGLFEFLGTGAEVKRVHPGKAARDGILAAELAARGVTGPATAMEGRNGYFRAYAAGEVDIDHLLNDLGRRWETMRIYVKPYPCCRHLHGPIDAVLALRSQQPIDLDAVRSIRVETYTVASHHNHRNVRDFLDAQMSIPYATAVALADGVVGLAQFSAAHRSRPDLRRLVEMVEVVAAPDCDAGYPKQGRPARVTLEMAGGARLSHRIAYPLGEPENQLSDRDLERKFHNVCGPVVGEEACARIIETVWNLSDMDELYSAVSFPPDNLRPAMD